MATATLSPADVLAALIARGVARYQESLPDFARPLAELPEPEPNLTLTDERQREICLSCRLADCVGIESATCPIRIEQRRVWRKQRRQRQWPN